MLPYLLVVIVDCLLYAMCGDVSGLPRAALYGGQWFLMLAAFLLFPRLPAKSRAWGLMAAGMFATRVCLVLAQGVPVGPRSLVALGFDLVTLCLLFDLLRRRGHDPRWALLFGLNPLVTWFHAWGDGALVVALCVAALAVLDRSAGKHRGAFRAGVSVLLSGLAVLCTLDFMNLAPIGIAVVAMMPRLSWLVLSFCGAAYVSDLYWELESLVGRWSAVAAVWSPVYVLLFWEAGLGWMRWRSRGDLSEPDTMSVVIPALNEGAQIAHTVEAVVSHSLVKEVIVVDGGSRDDTIARARAAGATVLDNSEGGTEGRIVGRGGHIRVGVGHASGDVIVILHADTTLTARDLSRVMTALRGNPEAVGGAVGSVFDGSRAALRAVEAANDLRGALMGISFGDQVQFFRRKPVMEGKGVPDIPLMEDVELSLRLCGMGRVLYLFGEARVSARSWTGSAITRTVLVLSLVGQYLVQRIVGMPDVEAMYRRYYGER